MSTLETTLTHHFRKSYQSWSPLTQDLLLVLSIFLVWRTGLLIFDFIGLNLSTERISNINKDWQAFPEQGKYLLDSFFRWDGGWYKRIIEKGYYIEGSQSNVTFFPLYPYLCRYIGYITGNFYSAGLIISNLSAYGGLFFIFRIAEGLLDREKATRALILILVFPSSFFLSVFYTEGLFLFVTSASIYFFLKHSYTYSGLFGLFATMTRASGILLFAVLGLVLFIRCVKQEQTFNRRMLGLLLIPVGLLIFMAMLQYQVDDALAFVRYQSGWGRKSMFPLYTLLRGVASIDYSFPRDSQNMIKLLDLSTALGFLAVSLAMIRRYPMVLWSFTLASVLLPLLSGSLMSTTRFCGVIFPAFIYLADVSENRYVDKFLIYGFSMLLALSHLRFMNWFWMG